MAATDDPNAAYDRLDDEGRWKVECLTKVFMAGSASLSRVDERTFLLLLPLVVSTGEFVEDPAEGARRMGRSVNSYRSSLKRLAAAGHIEFDGARRIVIDVSEKRVEEGARLWDEIEAEMEREGERWRAGRRQRNAARRGVQLH